MFFVLFFLFQISTSQYQKLVFPFNGVDQDNSIDVVETGIIGLIDMIKEFANGTLPIKTIIDYIGYFQPGVICDEYFNCSKITQEKYEKKTNETLDTLSNTIKKFVFEGSLVSILNGTIDDEAIEDFRYFFSQIDYSKPLIYSNDTTSLLFVQFAPYFQKHFTNLTDFFRAVDINIEYFKTFISNLNDPLKKYNVSMNDLSIAYGFDLSTVLDLFSALSKLFNTDYTFNKFFNDLNLDIASYHEIESTILEIFETKSITFAQFKNIYMNFRDFLYSFKTKFENLFEFFVFQYMNKVFSLFETYSLSERIQMVVNSVDKIDAVHLCNISDDNSPNFYCFMLNLKEIWQYFSNNQNIPVDIYNDLCNDYGNETIENIFNTIIEFLNGSSLYI